MKDNIILVDYEPEEKWGFIKGLQQTTKDEWKVKKIISNQARTSVWSNVRRYIIYFLASLNVFLHRKKYNQIIAWQQFYGIIFAFYCKVFHVKKSNPLVILTFIYKEKMGLAGKIYKAFMTYVIESVYIDKFICYSREECELYKKVFSSQKQKFYYCLFGFEDARKKYSNLQIKNNGRIYSSGRSNRDYEFIIDALSGSGYNLDIICDTFVLAEKKDFVHLYNDLHLDEKYFKIIAESSFLILSCKDENISSGQLVLLEAFQFEKPVIATYSKGIEDYIIDGYNGFLISKNTGELMKRIKQLMSDRSLYVSIAKNARATYEKNFTELQLGERIGEILKLR